MVDEDVACEFKLPAVLMTILRFSENDPNIDNRPDPVHPRYILESCGITMIRLAEARDEPAIRNCAAQAYARYVPVIGRKPAPMIADFTAQIAAGVVIVAIDDQGRLQGFVVFHAMPGYFLLENVAVLPSAAGHGVGKALIRFCENSARQRGVSAVHLYTNKKMIDNLVIYPRLGYVKVAERVEDGFERVYFEKCLE